MKENTKGIKTFDFFLWENIYLNTSIKTCYHREECSYNFFHDV